MARAASVPALKLVYSAILARTLSNSKVLIDFLSIFCRVRWLTSFAGDISTYLNISPKEGLPTSELFGSE